MSVAAVVRRFGAAAVVLAAVSGLLFVATEVLPGDAASARLGSAATPEAVAALRERSGLSGPPGQRYLDWLGAAVTGDLGRSLAADRPVTELLVRPLGHSALLAGLGALGILTVAIVAGVLAGTRPGSGRDVAVSTGVLVLVSLPEFLVAAGLVAVLVWAWPLLPPTSLVPAGGTPLGRPEILVLPVLTVVIVGSAWVTRLVRAAVADAAATPHVEAAHLAGLGRRQVLVHHLLPTAAPAIAPALAAVVLYLAGGTIVAERVFAYPGLGSLLVDAVAARDVPVVQAVGLLLATVVVTAFVLADLLAAATTPRRVAR